MYFDCMSAHTASQTSKGFVLGLIVILSTEGVCDV